MTFLKLLPLVSDFIHYYYFYFLFEWFLKLKHVINFEHADYSHNRWKKVWKTFWIEKWKIKCEAFTFMHSSHHMISSYEFSALFVYIYYLFALYFQYSLFAGGTVKLCLSKFIQFIVFIFFHINHLNVFKINSDTVLCIFFLVKWMLKKKRKYFPYFICWRLFVLLCILLYV